MSEGKPRHRTVQRAVEHISYGVEERNTSSQFKVSDDGKDTGYVDGCFVRYSPTVTQIRDNGPGGGFGEEVMPGALKGADTSDIKFVINHGAGGQLPLARWCPSKKIDTLQLDERKDGVYFRAAVPLTSQLANDLLVALHTKSIDQCSYAFSMDGGQQRWSANQSHRSITRWGSIHDVSVVTMPAESSTFASVGDTSAARAIATAEQEMRSGKVISKKTAAQLLAVHKQMSTASQLHSGAKDAVAYVLSANGYGGALDDGTVTGPGGGQQAPGAPGQFGDGTGSRSYPIHSMFATIEDILDADYLTGEVLAETITAWRAEESEMEGRFKKAERYIEDIEAERRYIREGGS